MPKINVDGQEYELDTLPDTAKQQIPMLQFIEAELARLQVQTAILQTARINYSNALKQALPPPPPTITDDTIKFG